jgi:enoyl-CoA hydratase
MSYETLLLSIDHGVALLTINRPDRLNALNVIAKEELDKVFSELEANPSVSVVVVTGAGEKSFVAGTDIGELSALDETSGRAFALRGQAIFNRIESLSKPVLAAVNGYALGGGCELALACHMRIASDKARFGQPEVSLGIIPGYGGTQRLARIIGTGLATELILTGRQVDAVEAQRIGLVSTVVPASDLIPRALALASSIASLGQVAIRYALEALRASNLLPIAEGMAREADLFGLCCASDDFREGVRAFLEKRKPEFRNR